VQRYLEGTSTVIVNQVNVVDYLIQTQQRRQQLILVGHPAIYIIKQLTYVRIRVELGKNVPLPLTDVFQRDLPQQQSRDLPQQQSRDLPQQQDQQGQPQQSHPVLRPRSVLGVAIAINIHMLLMILRGEPVTLQLLQKPT